MTARPVSTGKAIGTEESIRLVDRNVGAMVEYPGVVAAVSSATRPRGAWLRWRESRTSTFRRGL